MVSEMFEHPKLFETFLTISFSLWILLLNMCSQASSNTIVGEISIGEIKVHCDEEN
jgi:hypothetical protein